ncbi:reverse transcriptase domain-containing protein [Tanacetum coccineum]|uniref:Reverse transcriptase domain-containing protein n=1 Tax=Tanacetum coccineum TaxID=301880 RepID=A0ABQ4ZEP9_9ASTR
MLKLEGKPEMDGLIEQPGFGLRKNHLVLFLHRRISFDASFGEAWDRFKDLLRKCPHHGFSELHQIDTFYNALTQSDQDSLNAAAGGNLLNRTPRDALTIIKNKSKIIKELVLMNKATQQATVKAIDETCVICGGPHPYYECLATGGNTFDACVAVGTTRFSSSECEEQQSPSGSGSLPSDTVANPRGSGTRTGGDKGQGSNYKFRGSNRYTLKQTNASNEEGRIIKDCRFLQIFQRLHFDISFADSLLHMPKFASTFKSLLTDLDASINLMPLSIWKKLSLPELTPTHMTLKLANRSVAYLVGVAKDVFVKVGKFHFLADFVVVDYDVDPWVPLILGRPFLRTARALIDVHGEELTLRVNDEGITFKVGHTLRYSRNYYNESVNQINVIVIACEEYAQEVLEFSDSSTSGNPTPSDPINVSSSLLFTPFEGGDFILEEIKTFLHTLDKPSNFDDDYYDTKGDILYLENFK